MNLKKTALLNTITSAIDYGVRLAVNFILNPIILNSLGGYFFSIWKVLRQLNSYMATGDLKAATSLKWIISKDRNSKENSELAHSYSTAIYSFLLLLPLYITIGVIIVMSAPYVTKSNLEDYYIVRSTSVVLVSTFILMQFFFLYESLLHAMNMAYKRIGLRSVILIIGGAGNIIVLKLGYSIFEMALVNMGTIVLNGGAMFVIAKNNISWLSIVKVKFKEIKSFTILSFQYTLQKVALLLSNSSDLLLLGFLAGPEYVVQYTFTIFAMIGIKGFVQMITTAIVPGIGTFYGEKNYEKVFNIRQKLLEIKRMLLTVCSIVICLFNKSFIELWTDNTDLYSGQINTYLITILATFRVLSIVDKSFINISLKIKRQILISILSSIIIITLSFILIPFFNITGLLIALVIGVFTELLLNASYLQRLLRSFNLLKDLAYSKSFIISNIVILLIVLLVKEIDVTNWGFLIFYTLLTATLSLILYWFLILNKTDKNWIVESVKTSIMKNKKHNEK